MGSGGGSYSISKRLLRSADRLALKGANGEEWRRLWALGRHCIVLIVWESGYK